MSRGTTEPSRRLLRHALSAVCDQNFAVFPLVPRSKTPALKGWADAATRDPDRLREWFDLRPYNIGIATGPSDLVVVDLDDAHGEPAPASWSGATHGQDVLARLAAAADEKPPSHTYTVRTPTGGVHLYFRPPAGLTLRNTMGTLGWRIDTRADGGYVVGAGSVRPEGYYSVLRSAPIAPLPGWLARALTPPPPPLPPAPVQLPAGRAGAYLQAVLDGECSDVASAATGSRHRTLLRAARVLGEFVGGEALELEVARSALRAAAACHIGVDGCTAREVAQTVEDGLRYGRQRPRRVTDAGARGPARRSGEHAG